MEIIIWVLIFSLGLSLGYLIKDIRDRRASTSGTIYVTHGEEKTLYSLELNEYPEAIEFKKVVVFKVESLDSSLRDASIE